MGRAFEFRKARKMKRWSAMAKTFTRIGKDIVMAVKEGGPNPDTNSRLRAVIQNAKAANMPKDNVERAIKKASDKNTADYKEVLFEGYAPHGIAILVETATDNNNRTVANVRASFNKCDGTFGTSGSVIFMFDHTCNFRINSEGLDAEEIAKAGNRKRIVEGSKSFPLKVTPEYINRLIREEYEAFQNERRIVEARRRRRLAEARRRKLAEARRRRRKETVYYY